MLLDLSMPIGLIEWHNSLHGAILADNLSWQAAKATESKHRSAEHTLDLPVTISQSTLAQIIFMILATGIGIEA